jgi:predicted DNA-binding ribbon-helix-helix protein
MNTAVIKRSVVINDKKTSVSLYGLPEIAAFKKMAVPALVEQIDRRRNTVNLSSTIRIFVFNYFRSPARNQKRSRPGEANAPEGPLAG